MSTNARRQTRSEIPSKKEVKKLLVEKISTPWVLFHVLANSLTGRARTEAAKAAFLAVIARKNGYQCNKTAILEGIINKCPEVTENVTDEEINQNFDAFLLDSLKQANIVSVKQEMSWVIKYVRDGEVQTRIERGIYKIMLRAASLNEMRSEYPWSISETDKLGAAKELIVSRSTPVKRKMELAKEFDLPTEKAAKIHFMQLLWNRRYDEAKALGFNQPDAVIQVIGWNINNEYYRDAMKVAEAFLPGRSDILEEIQQITKANIG
ncbi:MAG: hypothetical protein Q7S47_01025 [bacterium]|nr:hypothetical protein [bacterium]